MTDEDEEKKFDEAMNDPQATSSPTCGFCKSKLSECGVATIPWDIPIPAGTKWLHPLAFCCGGCMAVLGIVPHSKPKAPEPDKASRIVGASALPFALRNFNPTKKN